MVPAFTSRVFRSDTRPPAAERVIPTRWILALLIVSMVAVALLMRGANLKIDPWAPGSLAFAAAFATLGAIRWACRRPRSQAARVARDIAQYFGLFTAFSVVGAVASYPVAAYSTGFADAALYHTDLALNFHWLDWYEVVAAHPVLQVADRAAYAMIYISPAILLGYLALTDKRREAHDFIAAMWLAATITLVAFRFMPAVGPLAYLWHGPIDYLPVSELWQPDLIPQLRDRTALLVDLGHLVGLVSAPSFHAAAAVLLLTFGARQPVVRVPLIVANIAMLLSTVVEGTHYLTDLILGAVVALVSIGIIALMRARFSHLMPLRPSSAPLPSGSELAMIPADAAALLKTKAATVRK